MNECTDERTNYRPPPPTPTHHHHHDIHSHTALKLISPIDGRLLRQKTLIVCTGRSVHCLWSGVVLCCVVLCCVVLYCIALCCVVLYCTALYGSCTVVSM